MGIPLTLREAAINTGVLAAILAASAVLLVACDNGGSDAKGLPPVPTSSCRKVPICDIQSNSCQQAIFNSTACERGITDVKMPEVFTVTEAEALALLLEEDSEADPQGALLPEWFEALSSIRMVGPVSEDGVDTNATLLANVAAFYVPTTKKAYVIDRDTDMDFIESMLVLSHEFVHAMQDKDLQLADYRPRTADSSDAFIALTAAVEGEATVTSMLFAANLQGSDPLRIAWGRFTDTLLNSILVDAAQSGVAYFILLQGLPYPLGAELMSDAWLDAGQNGIQAVFDTPPMSLGHWPSPLATRDRDGLRCFPTAAPSGYEAVDSDRLGPTGVAAIGLTADGDTSASFTADWLDDRAVLFMPSTPPDGAQDGSPAIAFRVRFIDAQVASDFVGRLKFLDPTAHVRFQRDDDEVLVVAASEASVVESWDLSGCEPADDLIASTWVGSPVSTMASRIFHMRQVRRIATHAHHLPLLAPSATLAP